MAKVLILLAVVLLLLWLLRPRRGQPPPDRQDRGATGPDAPPRPIVACAHCGVHLPRDEALLGTAGLPYCCEAHRRAAQQAD